MPAAPLPSPTATAHEHICLLPQLQARYRPLADLCRQLEAEFSCPVQTNIYLTPPNAQGFQTHYDNHDVLVLQVEGAKRWRLYDAPVGVPYRGERFTPGRFAVIDVSHVPVVALYG